MMSVSFTDSPAWPSIQAQLDALPVFSVGNTDGKPLQYQVNGQPMAVFYADIAAAKSELDAVKAQNSGLACDLVTVGLGSAYALCLAGKASLLPGVAELMAAGMPAGMPAMGQELPFFGCMQLTRDIEGGGTVVPLFMSFADGEAAAAVACAAGAGAEEELQMAPFALPSIVEHLSALAEDAPPPFWFVAPTASIEHVKFYVGDGVYYRIIEEGKQE
jgi:hypothetical protein